jgi:hypothetical protein
MVQKPRDFLSVQYAYPNALESRQATSFITDSFRSLCIPWNLEHHVSLEPFGAPLYSRMLVHHSSLGRGRSRASSTLPSLIDKSLETSPTKT